MSEKYKNNSKGDANVNSIEIIDLADSEITRKGDENQDWYDFQVEGKTLSDEENSSAKRNTDPKKVEAAMKRARRMFGHSVLGVLNMSA